MNRVAYNYINIAAVMFVAEWGAFFWTLYHSAERHLGDR